MLTTTFLCYGFILNIIRTLVYMCSLSPSSTSTSLCMLVTICLVPQCKDIVTQGRVHILYKVQLGLVLALCSNIRALCSLGLHNEKLLCLRTSYAKVISSSYLICLHVVLIIPSVSK